MPKHGVWLICPECKRRDWSIDPNAIGWCSNKDKHTGKTVKMLELGKAVK